MNKQKKINKIFNIIVKIFVICCVLYNIFYNINTIITRNSYISISDMRLLTIKSDCMEPDVKKNSLAIFRDVDDKIEDNDIIAYRENGEDKVSKVIYVNNENGNKTYIIKSNNNLYPHINPVKKSQVIGKIICVIPMIGIFINILQSKVFSILVVIIFILILIYKRYKYIKKMERIRRKKRKEFVKKYNN